MNMVNYYLTATHQPQVAPDVNPRSSKTRVELVNQQPWTESNSQDHGLNQNSIYESTESLRKLFNSINSSTHD